MLGVPALVAAVSIHPGSGGSNSEIALWAVGAALVGAGIAFFVGSATWGTPASVAPVAGAGAKTETGDALAANADRGGTAISASNAQQVAREITNYASPHATIPQATVDELAELMERAHEVYRRLNDPTEENNQAVVEACQEWHQAMRDFFGSKLSMSYYTRMHTHSGLVSFSGSPRLSWSPERIKWRIDVGNDTKRLVEILGELQQRVG